MSEERVQRKVTVILAADVVGYSTMMEGNEEQTLKNLKSCRAIIDGLISEYHGRIFNTAGDSVIAEFQSAVDAVVCASEFQKAIRQRNEANVEPDQMHFRVGINMGDVVIEEDNLYGEGVNVASRLEALAQPGGICLSKNVHEIVNNKTSFDFHDLGEQQVKNTTLHAVDVTLDGTNKRKLSQAQQIQKASPWTKYVAVAALVAVVVAVGMYWFMFKPDFTPADQSKYAFKLPDIPSIAILPFHNLSGNPDHEYISNGLAESIILELSNSEDMLVISRNSSFYYKNKQVNIQVIAEKLGVQYLLEGSVQVSGDNIRVSSQLVDALNGKNLWAERLDEKLDDLFRVQDKITQKISEELEIKLNIGEQGNVWREAIQDPIAFKMVVEFRTEFQKFSQSGYKRVAALGKSFCERLPESAMCHNLTGWTYFQQANLGFTENPQDAMKQARHHANKALEKQEWANPHGMLALISMGEKNVELAFKHIDRALELGPNETDVLAMGGVMKLRFDPENAIILNERLFRKDPFPAPHFIRNLALNHMILNNNQKAQAIFQSLLDMNLDHAKLVAEIYRHLSVISHFENDPRKAQEYTELSLKKEPNQTVAVVEKTYKNWKSREFFDRYLEALKTLGFP